MFTVRETEEFTKWLSGLKDRMTRIRLARRLDKVRRGGLGDVKSVGEGVFEMREDFGPGWRMYFFEEGGAIVVMLGGGEKSTQQRDIERAKSMARELRNEQGQDPSV
jgi:putative addiction module killer protein